MLSLFVLKQQTIQTMTNISFKAKKLAKNEERKAQGLELT